MAGEVREDRLFTDERLLAGGDEDGDRVGGSALAQKGALVLVDRDLAGEVVDAELGEPLPDEARGRAPLGLPELVHLRHRRHQAVSRPVARARTSEAGQAPSAT
jgi:hypothetical protein